MSKQRTWMEQWERVHRYYNRIEKLTKGIAPTRKNSPEFNFLDEFCAFFVFCYHLKDWIDNDTRLNLPRKIADTFVNENECLEICGDICNGIKHLHLDFPKRFPPAKFEKEARVSLKIDAGKLVSIRAKIFVSTDKGIINAFDLATESMDKWREFIRQHIEKDILDEQDEGTVE
jgi:hypothetical protein